MRISIAHKAVAVSVATAVCAVAWAALYEHQQSKEIAHQQVERNGRNVLIFLREVVRENDSLLHNGTLQSVLFRYVGRVPNINHISICDVTGRIIADSAASRVGSFEKDERVLSMISKGGGTSSTRVLEMNSDGLLMAKPLSGAYDPGRKSNVIGIASVYAKFDLAEMRISREFQATFGLFTLPFAAGVAMIYFVTRRTIISPLKDLRDASMRVARGDYSARTRSTRGDEIGDLQNSFNSMASGLEQTTQQLREEIRERQLTLVAREKLVRDLGVANQSLNEFAYVVSHDLKAPLRGIASLASWIREDCSEQLDETGKEHLDLLQARVRRMHNLIDGILNYSRVGRSREEKKAVNLNQMLPELVDSLSAPDHIQIRIPADLPVVTVRPTQIAQVFQNLLSNAIKFCDKPAGNVVISCQQNGDFWEFSVSDNGPGIEERYFEKIFQIFQTLKSRDEYESTGIGLAIVKKAVELNGGVVALKSVMNVGSTFSFTIPKDANQI